MKVRLLIGDRSPYWPHYCVGDQLGLEWILLQIKHTNGQFDHVNNKVVLYYILYNTVNDINASILLNR